MARNKNPRLKKSNQQIEYTPDMIKEITRCARDPLYFIENYVNIKGISGKSLFKLFDYQKNIIKNYVSNNRVMVLASRQVGKCCASTTLINIAEFKSKFKKFLYEIHKKIEINVFKNFIEDLCLTKSTISIGQLFDKSVNADARIPDFYGKLKFIMSGKFSNEILVETPSGYVPIKQIFKTVKYKKFILRLNDGNTLECADDHIVIDEFNNEILVKNLKKHNKIRTKFGFSTVLNVTESEFEENMYDIEIDDFNHVYYTNNILSHNTETSAAFILWFILFNDDKHVLIASNKSDNAKEIIGKIVYAYEELPNWLKPGINENTWNKFSLEFENKSRITAATTSPDTGRGLSIDLLYVDELAFVKPHIQDEFMTSILPTLASRKDGKMIISSTPNGDKNLFAEMWRGAESKRNGFYPIFVPWNAMPGRDEVYKNAMIKQFGIRKWQQEFECAFLSQESTLIDSAKIKELENLIDEKNDAFTVIDEKFVFWKKINKKTNYIIGVDPSEGGGNDNSVIQIFETPSLEQVAEYASNSTSSVELYKILKNCLKYLQHYGGESYFSIENNGLGNAIAALYEADTNPPESAIFISENGKNKRGFTTTQPSKIKSCLLFKELVDSNNIKINSKELLSELKSFVRSGGSYFAQVGATDDRITAVLVVLRAMEELSRFDDFAYHKLYSSSIEKIDSELQEYTDNPDDIDSAPMPFMFI